MKREHTLIILHTTSCRTCLDQCSYQLDRSTEEQGCVERKHSPPDDDIVIRRTTHGENSRAGRCHCYCVSHTTLLSTGGSIIRVIVIEIPHNPSRSFMGLELDALTGQVPLLGMHGEVHTRRIDIKVNFIILRGGIT